MELQNDLIATGYLAGTADGSFGPGTKSAALWFRRRGLKKEIHFPEAHYMDLTATLKAAGFIRMKAHSNWKTNPEGSEWWHFHYDKSLQETFQNEMELLGHDEATLRRNGWNTDAKLDRKPG